MANDNQPSYAKIGFAVVLGIVAIVYALVHLGGLGSNRDEILFETYYDQPVSGLSVGSAVNFRGVKVGEVRAIDFVGNRYRVTGLANQRIYILMACDRKLFGEGTDRTAEQTLQVLISNGLRATVTASGITGLSRIECDLYPQEAVTAAPPWSPEHIWVPAKMSLLDSFSVSAAKAMARLNKMDFGTAWSNVNRAIESLSSVADGLRNLIEVRTPEIERVLGNVESATSSFEGIADKVRENPAALLRGTKPERLPETTR